jgi:hypothetical protein
MSEHYVSELIREYEVEMEKIVPIRGTVHDIGRSVTHKAEVIRRWLHCESPAQIARRLNHSQDAVDRYLADFQKVRLLATKVPISDLPALTGLSASLVNEYIALLRQYDPKWALYSEDKQDSGLSDAAVPVHDGTEPDVESVPREFEEETPMAQCSQEG